MASFDIPEDFELPSSWNDYFKIDEGKHKIRLLEWPIMQYELWKEEVVDWKTKKVKETFEITDQAAAKMKWVKLVWNVLIYNYDDSAVQIWTISQRGIIQNLLDLNQEVPDMAWVDLTVIRKGKGMNDTTYTIIPGIPTPFADEKILAEVTEKPLLERITKKDDDDDKVKTLPGDEKLEAQMSEAFGE